MAVMLRPSLIVVAALGLCGLGLAGQWLHRDQAARSEQALRDEGHRQYWLVRRTLHLSEPHELVHQLACRKEDDSAVLALLDLRPGESAADVGCGSGFYTLEMASAVGPDGTVHALDIQEDSLAFLRERLEALGCPGCGEITLVHNRIDDVGLPPSSLDAMLMSHLDFHAYHPPLPENERMIASAAAALRPTGRLVVVQDLYVIPGGGEEHIVTNFEAVGLVLAEEPAYHEDSVLLIFAKP